MKFREYVKKAYMEWVQNFGKYTHIKSSLHWTLGHVADLSGTVRARQPVEERSKSKKIEISLSAVSTACVHTLEPKSLVRFCLVCSKLMILYYKAQISIWPF